MKVYEKILKARAIIREAHIEKKGRNDFSKYNYFTPEQIASMVNHACQDVGLLNVFSLQYDNFGALGVLRVVDIETGDDVISMMKTEIPAIKATNAAQQVGGCATYTERYMLQSMYQIADNSADFDAQDNSAVRKDNKGREVNNPKCRILTFDHPRLDEFKTLLGSGELELNKLIQEFDEIDDEVRLQLEDAWKG